MILGFGNNVVSALASDITSSQTTIPVLPGGGAMFAALLTSDFSNKSTTLKNYAKITLTDSGETAFEICHLTAVSGDNLTVIRGQEGTVAKGWALKDVIANFATRGSENGFVQVAEVQSGFYTSGTAGGSANALTLELPTTFFLNGSVDWVLKTPIVVYPSQNNTGAATLQLTMGGRVLGTFPLYKGNKAQLAANDILKDVALVCLLDNTRTFFSVANPGAIYAGLGTAAFHDVTISHEDTTPERVLRVGDYGLGRAINVPDGTNLAEFFKTARGVSYHCDALAQYTNVPAWDGVWFDIIVTVHEDENYRTLIAVNSLGQIAGASISNGLFSGWDMNLTTKGGSVDYLNNAQYYATKSQMWQGSGGFTNQYTDGTAPFFIPSAFTTPRDNSYYLPICKGVSQTDFYGYGSAVSFGILRSGTADFGQAVIHIIGDNGQGAGFYFDTGSNLSFQGQVRPGSFANFDERYIMRDGVSYAGFDSNNESLPYMRNASSGNIVYLARQDWVSGNFISGVMRGAQGSMTMDGALVEAPAGCFLTGGNGNEATQVGVALYRPLQVFRNGVWATIEG